MDERKCYVTVKEAARILDCHHETLRKAIRAGEVPAKRFSRGKRHGLIRIPVAWLMQTSNGDDTA